MPFYVDADQLYACTSTLFARIQEKDPGAGDEIFASRLVIRLCCTDPTAEITINGRQRPVQTTFGPSCLRPTLEIELGADTLHRIMLGAQSLKGALANGLLKIRGPAWKTLTLADLFHRGQALYPQVLRDHGLSTGL